jgi:DNA polymerase-3 subunit epsilon
VIDTLSLARRKHPMGPNSLDALCRRYGIDNSHRTKHGALLDSELLAEVYIEMLGGRQAALGLTSVNTRRSEVIEVTEVIEISYDRPRAIAARLSPQELEGHAQLVASLGSKAIWSKYTN